MCFKVPPNLGVLRILGASKLFESYWIDGSVLYFILTHATSIILLYLSNKLNIPCYTGARSGRNADIQPEGGDTLVTLGEAKCCPLRNPGSCWLAV